MGVGTHSLHVLLLTVMQLKPALQVAPVAHTGRQML
jgi:hypothetical protein